ncbi:MAG TPA: hypothetical protein VEU08_02375 [Vicinamibacterales bacterium]|nr:hypothetical protein [Vicinamibacterales bacterium]
MGLPREEMLQRMSSAELTGWLAYFQALQEEDDVRTGTRRNALTLPR